MATPEQHSPELAWTTLPAPPGGGGLATPGSEEPVPGPGPGPGPGLGLGRAARLPEAAVAPADQPPWPTGTVQALAAQHLAGLPGSGLAVLLADAAGTRVLAGGWADAAGRRPVGLDTGFDLGSVTKPLTAALLARLADAGNLRLDDPLERWLPGLTRPSAGAEPLRLVHLITHTSGLPRLPRSLAFLRSAVRDLDDPYAHYSRADFDRDLAGWTPPARLPAAFAYSNWGYAVLGRVVEAALGQPFASALQAGVLQPAAMAQAGLVPGPQHAVGTHQGQPVPHWQLGQFAAAGAVCATVADVAALLQALLHARAPFAAADLQPRAQLPAGQTAPGGQIALGWLLLPRPEGPLAWHNGGTGGFRSWIGWHPARGRAVAVLSNAQAAPDTLALHLLDDRLPAPPAPAPARAASAWGWAGLGPAVGAGAGFSGWLLRRRDQLRRR